MHSYLFLLFCCFDGLFYKNTNKPQNAKYFIILANFATGALVLYNDQRGKKKTQGENCFPKAKTMNIYVILATGTLVLAGEPAAASKNRNNCPETTTLASFNAASLPLFLSRVNGSSEIEGRVALLIQQVCGYLHSYTPYI